jgi:hypothetical protein
MTFQNRRQGFFQITGRIINPKNGSWRSF